MQQGVEQTKLVVICFSFIPFASLSLAALVITGCSRGCAKNRISLGAGMTIAVGRSMAFCLSGLSFWTICVGVASTSSLDIFPV